MTSISVPIALKIYKHGLNRLLDPNWTGLDLFYLLKKPVREQELLLITRKEGLLFYLGLWFYKEYILNEGDGASGPFLILKGEYLAWYLEDLLEMLTYHKSPDTNVAVKEQQVFADNLFKQDEECYLSFVESRKGRRELEKRISKLRYEFSDLLRSLAALYADDYAQRLFHDRELCGYVSELVIRIGYPGVHDETGNPWQWVERRSIPEWAKRAVCARDRGLCAECGANIGSELEAPPSIDHIMPLAIGGSNDLANLQLLCQPCNLKKCKDIWPVRSSIPKYLQRNTL
jgi:hypothetical protein